MKRTGAKTGAIIGTLLALSVLAGCARAPIATVPMAEREAISASLMRDIRILSSDEFGGRQPGTLGEQRTLAFLIEQMQAAGLESGTNDPGNAWRAPVQLVSTEPVSTRIEFDTGAATYEVPQEAALALTSLRQALVEDVELVFVGYEAERVADEDVAGRVVVMLGEPGISPARRDILLAKDPVAIITVVEDEAAITRQVNAMANERVLLAEDETSALSAFVTREAMRTALGAEYWEELASSAEGNGFAPLDVTATVTIEAESRRREFTSYNVIGRLPGSAPDGRAVLLLAHWDHLGECGSEDLGDLICNGAVDNASGLAVMLELARRLTAGGPHDRDIYFLATSAEESGLLGAKAFVNEPPVPLESILAAFNFDTVAVAPAGSPVGYVGEGRTSLDGIVGDVLEAGKRSLGTRATADQFLQRQDAWALLQEGVPAVVLSTAFGSQITLGPYLEQRYHQPGDEIASIELGGAIDDLLLHEELVRRIADIEVYPATGG